jgi:thiosulfate dehydrogenase [quinone] large subunit
MKQSTISLLRVLMGWTFLWAFADKLIGLGFATCRDATTNVVTYLCSSAWVKGGSPTSGFLKFAVKGPFADYFHSLVGNPIVDWLFMIGLAAVGLTLILGVLVRLGSWAGAVMMLLIYAAGSILPENNPFLDEHIIYAVLLFGIAQNYPGLFRWKS